MNWKKIIKRQTTFMDFGMTAPQGTMTRQTNESQMKEQMPQIRSKLESQKGRSTMRTPQGQVDSSEYWLSELDKVQSLEDFEAYKKNYKQMTNIDII